MASQPPPYHTPVYLENVFFKQMAETVTDSTGTQVIELDNDNLNPVEKDSHEWNLDPFSMATNEYFVKLNCDTTQVIQSSEEECGRPFRNFARRSLC